MFQTQTVEDKGKFGGLKTCLSIAPVAADRSKLVWPYATGLLLAYMTRAMRARRASRAGLLARPGSVRD